MKRKFVRTTILAAISIVAVAALVASLQAQNRSPFLNGFDLSGSIVPVKDIHAGGPPRDGIPAIDHPGFLRPNQVNYLRDDDLVVSVTIDGQTRAYPVRLLIRHEIVNDRIDDQAIVVSYCPLCGTAMVFSRAVAGQTRDFGVSGLLYQSDLLMYDRGSQSLFSQLAMKAITGPLAGVPLQWLPCEHIAWSAWRSLYPNGMVLSNQNGLIGGYSQNPYAAYAQSPGTAFPAPVYRKELPRKSWVLGVVLGGESKAYPLAKLSQKLVLRDKVGGIDVIVTFDSIAHDAAVFRGSDGAPLPSVEAYWFAWQAFHPDTLVW